jgi:hypothetical protein
MRECLSVISEPFIVAIDAFALLGAALALCAASPLRAL